MLSKASHVDPAKRRKIKKNNRKLLKGLRGDPKLNKDCTHGSTVVAHTAKQMDVMDTTHTNLIRNSYVDHDKCTSINYMYLRDALSPIGTQVFHKAVCKFFSNTFFCYLYVY